MFGAAINSIVSYKTDCRDNNTWYQEAIIGTGDCVRLCFVAEVDVRMPGMNRGFTNKLF